jgi:hypothetical protein
MVRDVWTVTGDIGIEVLPFVPVVMEGMDEVGRDLLGGLKDWVRWISEKSGRGAIAKLAETCGRESESVGCEVPMIWKPSFMLQHGRQGGWDVLAGRGNTLTLIRSERVEAVVERVSLRLQGHWESFAERPLQRDTTKETTGLTCEVKWK